MNDDLTLLHPQPSPSTRRYWSGVALFVALLLAAIALVLVQGNHPTLRARRIVPEAGSTVSVRPAIRVRFARPVDKSSVERTLTILPEVPYDLSWNENELRLLPRIPLEAETEYLIRVGPGVLDADGDPLRGALEWGFRTRQPRIAYLRPAADESNELWLNDLAGGSPSRLSAPGQVVQDFDAAPNGSTIVYTVEEGQNSVNIWRVEPQQQGLTRLTEESGTVYGAPRFSPSGDLLAVEVRQEVSIEDRVVLAPPALELRRPADGSPAGRVYGEGPEVGHSPRWSPDGTRLAFFEATQSSIAIFNFTSDLLFFPAESAFLGDQAWDPAGRALLYTRVVVEERGAKQVLAMRDLGMGTEIVLAEGSGDQADGAWSPDGSQIAYSFRPPPGLQSPGGIWIMRPDGSGRIPLVTEAGVLFTQPTWSPDGEWVLFGRFALTEPDARQSLWAIRSDGTSLHQIAEEGYQPEWVP